MCAGVGKSGSPAPNPMTFSPAAFSALAFASTASVADSWMAAIRAEMREEESTTVPWWHVDGLKPEPISGRSGLTPTAGTSTPYRGFCPSGVLRTDFSEVLPPSLVANAPPSPLRRIDRRGDHRCPHDRH